MQRREWGLQQSELSTRKRGTTVQIQQISSWRSVYGSDMGGPMPLQLPGGFDETIPMTTIAQAKKLVFKKPFMPVKKFQVVPPT